MLVERRLDHTMVSGDRVMHRLQRMTKGGANCRMGDEVDCRHARSEHVAGQNAFLASAESTAARNGIEEVPHHAGIGADYGERRQACLELALGIIAIRERMTRQ